MGRRSRVMIKNEIIKITIIVLILFLTQGCQKQKICRYADMIYNKKSKQCECIQAYSPEEIPALSSTEYNSCGSIVRNFFYLSIDNADYPYYSHAGDTIKFCGYVKHSYGRPLQYNEDSTYCQFTMIDDYATAMDASNHNGGAFFVESLISLMGNVDITQKCYVKGLLSFGSQSAVIPWVSISEPGSCRSEDLLFNVIDIHN